MNVSSLYATIQLRSLSISIWILYKKSTYNVGNDRTGGQVGKHYRDDYHKIEN